MDAYQHNITIAAAIVDINAGLDELRLSVEASDNPLIKAVIHQIEAHLAMIDGHNEVYPFGTGETVQWSFYYKADSASATFHGKTWSVKGMDGLNALAKREYDFYAGYRPDDQSPHTTAIRNEGMAAWSEIMKIVDDYNEGGLKAIGIDDEPRCVGCGAPSADTCACAQFDTEQK